MDVEEKEDIRKQARRWRSVIKNVLSLPVVFNSLLLMVAIGTLFWIVQALYVLSVGPNIIAKDAIYAVNHNAPGRAAQNMRGLDGVEYLELPGPDDPIEIPGDWLLPPITHPLIVPSKPMKRLMDGPENYPDSSYRHMHGKIGLKEDGSEYEWVNGLDVSLDREHPDYRKPQCKDAPFYSPNVQRNLPATTVVIIFSNEPWETLMRSVHSILNNTPPHLLYEIILVDDGSTFEDYTIDGNHKLVNYIKHSLPRKVKLTRTNTRAGITRARLQGIKLAKADMFVVLDSHIECEPGWLEPLVYRTNEIPTAFTMPMIDSIQKNGWVPSGNGVGCSLGIIWKVMEHALNYQEGISPEHRRKKDPWGYISSPSMSGGLFGGHKQVFLDLGGYDLDMSGWGAENVEFGLRLWQCGARLDCSECSRVGHVFGRGQFYKQKGGEAVINRLRTAGVWMDEFGILPRIFNHQQDWRKMGDIKERVQIRKTLKCHNFKWFLDNIWPESDIRDMETDIAYHGPIKNRSTGLCVQGRGKQAMSLSDQCKDDFFYFTRSKRVNSGYDDEAVFKVKGNRIFTDWPNGGTELEVILLYSDDGIQLKMINKCISADVNENALVLAECDSTNSLQLWDWPTFDYTKFEYFSVPDLAEDAKN